MISIGAALQRRHSQQHHALLNESGQHSDGIARQVLTTAGIHIVNKSGMSRAAR